MSDNPAPGTTPPDPKTESFRAYFERRYERPYPGRPGDPIADAMMRVAEATADWMGAYIRV